VINLCLRDSIKMVLDRVFDGDYFNLWVSDFFKNRIQCGCFS
jgi:hypothetical protein